jgi:preprotein translocase subunit SecE
MRFSQSQEAVGVFQAPCICKAEAVAVAKKEATKEAKREAAAPQSGEGFDISSFLKGTKEELSKVVWPSRQQLISESAAVILMVSLSATIIYLIDQLFGWASGQIF